MTSAVKLRPLADGEDRLVVEAAMGTLNWPGPRFIEDEARSDPEIEHYLRVVPERGDFGVVAEAPGGGTDGSSGTEPAVVGLVWLMFFPEEDPGYGFVENGVPEYAIWVREGWRGQGIGRALTRAAMDEARRRGITKVSLSVEDDNPSRFLYLSEGFVPVPGGEEDGVMLKTL